MKNRDNTNVNQILFLLFTTHSPTFRRLSNILTFVLLTTNQNSSIIFILRYYQTIEREK